MIASLIDKQDTCEIVRDKIAEILATEAASQLALAAGEPDPSLWKLRIYSERSAPWEQFQENDPTDRSPLINVWYDSTSFDGGASNTMERQTAEGIFNIDCYGFGVAADAAVGHSPGDRAAAFEVQRAVRLVRNILMSAEYHQLQMQGTVAGRWPTSIQSLQGELNDRAVQNVMGARLSLRVRFNEFAPQVVGDVLEQVSVTVRRKEDGEIVILADYV